MNAANFSKLIKNNPECFVYLFITREQYQYFPAGSPVLQKIVNQAQQGAKMFSQFGYTAQQAVQILANNIKAKYGLTPQQFIVSLAKGITPVAKSGFAGIGEVEVLQEPVEVDPETGLPVSLFEEAEKAEAALNGVGEISFITPEFEQTLNTPLPVFNAGSGSAFTMNAHIVISSTRQLVKLLVYLI